MSIYSRARRHINMERVKELKEEKYIKNLEKQQEIVLAEISRLWKEKNKHYDWRTGKNLTEGMTTAAIGLVNLPVEGDVDIVNTNTVYDGFDSSRSQNANYSRSGTTVTLVGTENQINNGTHTFYNVARYVVDGSKSSTLKVTIQKGGGPSSWTDRDGESTFDDDVTLNVGDDDDFFAPLYNNTNLTSGTHIIRLPSNYKNLLISFEQFGKVGETGALRITHLSLQRRTPLSVLVSLDDPDASSFIRDGKVDSLSPGEKKKKLEEQLASSKEYLNKMFGEGMPNTATTIADYEPQQSFADIKVGLSPEDLKAISDRVGGSYSGGKVDQKIAAAQQGPIPPGPRGYKKPGTYNPDKFYQYRPEKPASPNLPFTGPGYSKGIDGTEVAAGGNPRGTGGKSAGDPDNIQWPRNKYPNKKAPPGPGYIPPTAKKTQTTTVAASYPTTNTPLDKVGGFKGIPKGKGIYPMDKDGNLYNPQTGLPIKKAGKRQRTMVAHHELEGEVIVEKKRLKSPKDLADKIPGYYDGKPAPLGFPIVEPPKMKDGMHPDLVDGKKTAKRFNRLDPVSARAMPKTGNPYIDKKVKAAAKKPK